MRGVGQLGERDSCLSIVKASLFGRCDPCDKDFFAVGKTEGTYSFLQGLVSVILVPFETESPISQAGLELDMLTKHIK